MAIYIDSTTLKSLNWILKLNLVWESEYNFDAKIKSTEEQSFEVKKLVSKVKP